ncbi:MAG: MauE/DoxX family redox-associated membrane protein [Pseudonocardiaceae bacterium]
MILLGVPVLAGAFLLLEAGLEHLRAPRFLARAAGTGVVAARAIAAVEFVIGVLSVAAVVFGTTELRWALAAQTVMYAAFAAHLSWRRYRGDESGCGCNPMGTQVGPGGIARAVVLAIATLAATALYPAVALPGGGIAIALVACAAVLAVLLYTLPAAVDGRTA